MKGCSPRHWWGIGLIVGASALPMAVGATEAPTPTIDRISMIGFLYSSAPGLGFSAFTRTTKYFMSDGTSWVPNYVYSYQPEIWLDHVETTADSLRYVFASGSALWSETAFELVTQEDRTRRASYGTLGAARPITMRAAKGGTTAIMEGTATITGNDRAWNSPHGEPPFSYFSSVRGAVVPFRLTYEIRDKVWSEHVFDSTFTYVQSGEVDFGHPVSTPALTSLELAGSSHLPDGITVPYRAVAHYESGADREVTSAARWNLAPGTPATQANGTVTIPTLSGAPASLVLTAAYTEAGIERTAVRMIEATPQLAIAGPGEWPTLQAGPRHEGHQHLSLEPLSPRLLWARMLDARFEVHPVAVAEGRVFATLQTNTQNTPQAFALDASTGEILWSRNFGSVRTTNPPTYAYRNLYVQTGRPDGQHTEAALYALDAVTGEVEFRTIFGAQRDRFLAPAVVGRAVYMGGGYGVGIDAYDAFSGERQRFVDVLPSQEKWTPAVDEQRVFAYLGTLYEAKFYSWDRFTGRQVYAVRDSGFESYQQNMTPVLGDLDDALVINGGRLLCFDRTTGAARWRLSRAFSGMACVAHGVVYAIDGGRLVAIDEASHEELWSWTPPEGTLSGSLITCETHVFCSTSAKLYAVGVATHASEWSTTGSGKLSLADGVLYVAGKTGTVTAFQLRGSITATLIQDFRAVRGPAAVELSWVLPNPESLRRVTIERAQRSEGPWTSLPLEARQEGQRGWASDPATAFESERWYRLVLEFGDASIHRGLPVQVSGAAPGLVRRFALASPNPASGPVRFEFGLEAGADTKLRVFDVNGREVGVLREGWATAGPHSCEWTPSRSLPAGLYFALLEFSGARRVLRLTLLR